MIALLKKTPSVSAIRDSIPEPLFTRISRRIAREEEILIEYAEQILEKALMYLMMCAKNPGKVYPPSPEADIGWHAFLMYTKEYQEFCSTHAGSFIHHCPTDTEGSDKNCNNHCENNE
jgi:hypothetical protein